MKLLSVNAQGNVHDAVRYANSVGLAPFVVSVVPVTSNGAILVLRIERYAHYVELWNKLGYIKERMMTEKQFYE